MKSLFLVAAVLLMACGGTKTPAADTTLPVATAPLDSTVQHKTPPDTLIRGDGAICKVNARMYTVAELGKPFICNWSK